MTATTADRYERAAQSLGIVHASVLSNDAGSALAGAFTAFGLLWGTEPRSTWEEASRITHQLQQAYTVTGLCVRIRNLREHLEVEAKRMRPETATG